MTSVIIVIETENTQALIRNLERKLLPDGLAGYLRAEMEPYLQEATKDRFNSEGSDVGGWVPLASATVAIRESLGYGGEHPINVRTGALEQDLTQAYNSNIVGTNEGAMLVYPDSDTFALPEHDKLRVAQGGSTSPLTPARPVLAVTERDLAFFITSLELYILEGVMV